MKEFVFPVAPSNPRTRIWRYMSLSKLISMIDSSSLYFSRSDLMSDPFEGSSSWRSVSKYKEWYGDERGIVNSNGEPLFDHYRKMKNYTYLNCWHISASESVAMWRLYSEGSECVAIRSTYLKLRESLNDEVYISKVKYLDFEKEFMPVGHISYPFVHKLKEYSFERELRCIYHEMVEKIGRDGKTYFDLTANSPQGIKFKVNMDALIDEIVISPFSPEWFSKVVESILRKYDLEYKILKSKMRRNPVY